MLSKINDVVDRYDTDDLLRIRPFGHREGGDVVLIHRSQRVTKQGILADLLVGRRHHITGGDMQVVVLLDGASEIAVGDDTYTLFVILSIYFFLIFCSKLFQNDLLI